MTAGVQNLRIRQLFPAFSFVWRNAVGVWRGYLQPSETSPAYRVEVRYQQGGLPTVRVLQPTLIKGAPHLYREGHLCLYWPKEWHWRGDTLIAETILPWTAQWLLYYELWLDTGRWLGPSSHDTKGLLPTAGMETTQKAA